MDNPRPALPDEPNPLLEELFKVASVDARLVSLAIFEVAKELRRNRESMENGPGWKMAEISLQQIQAQMRGGVLVVPTGMKGQG
jgi:hypothetical protein